VCNRSWNYEIDLNALRSLRLQRRDPPAFCGPIRHELEQAGQAIGAMDLLIAAHALAITATLVTNNLAHFQRISGLSVMRCT
jgi:tRNA(fMet)-specific endonuclease VapC